MVKIFALPKNMSFFPKYAKYTYEYKITYASKTNNELENTKI